MSPKPVLIVDLLEGCITENFWLNIVKPYWQSTIGDYLVAQQSAPQLRTALDEIIRETHSPHHDLTSICEYIVRCIELDQFSQPLLQILSTLTDIGLASEQLKPQYYPDALESLTRWKQKDWLVFSAAQIATTTQRLLLQYTQQGDLQHCILDALSFSLTTPDSLRPTLPSLSNCILISTNIEVLKLGQRLGHRPILINRYPYHQYDKHNDTEQVWDRILLELVDLNLLDSLIAS